ncbi:MAG: carbon-nitrogen hydrolase family protein [Candidatus Omnitrophota bacterium]|nr:carbon-nitrogen hydrolase family protein [Candidatus Omnitrophota bacterium]MDZ4241207.1 carbon-nitrogen hydrolase family protein [Candidatus Omnitrophota bacterium]
MKVAAVQMGAGPDKAENVRRALALVREAAGRGARFVALPEVFSYRGPLTDETMPFVCERIPGESLKPLCEFAAAKKIFILAGSVIEKSPVRGKGYNTSVLINGRGKIAAKYRKIHLFDAALGGTKIRESLRFVAGRAPAAAAAGGFKVGLTVCYDLRFPWLYERYSRLGCDLLTVPSAFTRKTGQAHWEILLRARAIENLCYVLAPNQVGADHRGVVSYGNSMIVSPWGEVLARASGDREQVIYADVDSAVIKQSRDVLPGIGKTHSPKRHHKESFS